MVVHEDEGMDADPVPAARLAKHTAVVVTVLVVEEDGTAVHAALGDVLRDAGQFESGLARHRGRGLGCASKVPQRRPAGDRFLGAGGVRKLPIP